MKYIILTIALLFALNIHAQDDKTVSLVVSGQGKTKEEAKQNVLRNAIEQAFGAFISSKTEILNDDLVKDEIVAVSNGNIKKYDIISELQLSDGVYALTLNVTVAVGKLRDYFINKGIEIELNGDLLAANFNLIKLNNQNEIKALHNLAESCKEILNRSCDFKISSEKVKYLNDNQVVIPLSIQVVFNKNIENFKQYLTTSLIGLSMTPEQAKEYLDLNRKVYGIAIGDISDLGLYESKSTSIKSFHNELKRISDKKPETLFSLDRIISGPNPTYGNEYFSKSYTRNIGFNNFTALKKYHNYGLEKAPDFFSLDKNRLASFYIVKDSFPTFIYLRNSSSIKEVSDIIFYIRNAVLNFKITIGNKTILGNSENKEIKNDEYQKFYPNNFVIKTVDLNPIIFKGYNNNFAPQPLIYTDQYKKLISFESDLRYTPDLSELKFEKKSNGILINESVLGDKNLSITKLKYGFLPVLNSDFHAVISLYDFHLRNKTVLELNYNAFLNVEDVSQLNSIKIEPIWN